MYQEVGGRWEFSMSQGEGTQRTPAKGATDSFYVKVPVTSGVRLCATQAGLP